MKTAARMDAKLSNQNPDAAAFSQDDILGCSRSSQITKPFPFKHLPREIREQIYDYVFEVEEVALTTYHTFKWIPITTGSTQLASSRDPQTMLALLLVDHEIFRESVVSFYARRIFSTGSGLYSQSCIKFLKGIGRQRLYLIRTFKYSFILCSDGDWDRFGQWNQKFWYLIRPQWRTAFQYLRLARDLRTLEINLGCTALTRRGLTPYEWVELETCLVGIKERVDLLVSNGCEVSVRDNPMQCEGMTTKMASQKNYWTCKKGETEWSPMESVYMPEWCGVKPNGVLKRSCEGPCGPCSVHMDV